MIVVAKDLSGDYTSLQQAVDALPDDGTPSTIFLKAGVYRERVVLHKDNVRLIGEDRDKTVITASGCAKDPDETGQEGGTFLSATLTVTGQNVSVENLTCRNDAGDGRIVGQAVAVYAAGDRGAWRRVTMIAHQDTLFCGPLEPKVVRFIAPRQGRAEIVPAVNEPRQTFGRQYFEDCFIQGDVDFIFGSYRCYFEGCTLYMGTRGGFYTAPNTPEGQPYGLVFRSCTLTGECEKGQAYLGRPWRKYGRALFLNCEMDEHVAPQGFIDWDEGRPVTALCGEYGTTGARKDQGPRHPAQKRLTADEAAQITPANVIGGENHWMPQKETQA